MTYRSMLFCCLLMLTAANTFAGYNPGKNKPAAKTTLADPGEGDYDIKYLNFKLQVADTSIYIKGDVSTTAQVISSSMSNYIFELDSVLTIDSAKVNGTLLPVTAIGFTRTIALPAALSGGTFFTAEIFYHGTPPTGTIPFFNGITHSVSSGGTHMIYTVSDPWVAKDWWPCKQSANDKIDSVDMFVTVPRDEVDGSNGLLVNVDTTSNPGFWQYHWQTHYAIEYYLISIAVAKFSEYRSYMHFTGSSDSMLIQNFFMDTATFNPLYKANFDSVGQMVDYFSSLFGRYPFWQEKYGMCYTTLGGGMENQTMTTIGVTDTKTIAHELMHQWFGDNVTYATWGEMWLSEGFATWAEQLFLTHFWGTAAGTAHRQYLLAHTGAPNILSQPCGEMYVTDTSGPMTLFDYSLVYAKGQGVITMLRYMAPTDSQFFLALRTYQQTYAYSNASIVNLATIFNSVYGFSVDSFLSQWSYGKGYPKYTITWDQADSTVLVKLVQTRSCPTYNRTFITPVELGLNSATGNIAVQAYNTADTQIFIYNWSDVMTSLTLNPDALTICKLVSITHDTTLRNTLSAGNLSLLNIHVFPNPSKNNWQVDQLPANTSLTLTDMAGRILWRGKSNTGIVTVPGTNLPAGNYLLKVNYNNRADSIKLMHW
jgi:aminopeptidase N